MKTIKIKHKIGDKVWILDHCYNIVKARIEEIRVTIRINNSTKRITEVYELGDEKTGFAYGTYPSEFVYKSKKEALNRLNNINY